MGHRFFRVRSWFSSLHALLAAQLRVATVMRLMMAEAARRVVMSCVVGLGTWRV